MGPFLLAGLTFLTVTGVILAVWWMVASERALQSRLARGQVAADSGLTITREAASDSLIEQIAPVVPWVRQLERLTWQAGWQGKSGRAFWLIVLFAIIGGVIGAVRLGHWVWGILGAVGGGMLPIFYLRYLRQKRMDKFSEQFPEALDMMTRSLRTGYAVGGAFQLVAEDMPDPVASEFKRVHEQISLGRRTTEALQEMYDRMKTEDVRFFYVAVSIQREVGGNLAEILDKLAQVVRERYKLLAFARVLSAQQKASAVCVGLSPFVVALAISLLRPGWFDTVWVWPYGKMVLIGGLIWMAIGALILRRIANITV